MEILTETKGDDWQYGVHQLTDQNGDLVTDLAGWECELAIFDRPEGTRLITRRTIDNTIDRVNSADGAEFQIVIPAALTSPLSVGNYFMRVRITSPLGVTNTVHRFSLRVLS